MVKGVVIDHDILGWGKSKEADLSKSYARIVKVGSDEIPRRQSDNVIAVYCRDHDCDLLTGDGGAYAHYFDAGIKRVRISRFEWYKTGDKPIYLVEIAD